MTGQIQAHMHAHPPCAHILGHKLKEALPRACSDPPVEGCRHGDDTHSWRALLGRHVRPQHVCQGIPSGQRVPFDYDNLRAHSVRLAECLDKLH